MKLRVQTWAEFCRSVRAGTSSVGRVEASVLDRAERRTVNQQRRLAVTCPGCGTRVAAPVPEGARGTPFGPWLHSVATDLKTFQALSYE